MLQIDASDKKLYNKIYLPIFKSKKRYNFIYWWAGSWKSIFLTQFLVLESFKKWNQFLIIRKTRESIKETVFEEIVRTIEKFDLKKYFRINVNPMHILNLKTNCSFVFRGIQDAEKLKSIAEKTKVWVEESTELTADDFDQLDLRLRGKNKLWHQIYCSFNPVDVDHWLNRNFISKGKQKDTLIIKSTYLDNKFIDDHYKKVMERIKTQNPSKYKIYALWEWWTLEWLIFENIWQIANVPENANLLCYWLDFWFSNDVTALIAIYMFDGQIILDELIYQTHLIPFDLIEKFKRLWIVQNVKIWADSSNPSAIEEIKRAGFMIEGAKKWADSIIAWINKMLNFKILVTNRSANLQKEFSKYVWEKNKNWNYENVPIDDWNHWIDAARYWISMHFAKNEGKIEICIW